MKGCKIASLLVLAFWEANMEGNAMRAKVPVNCNIKSGLVVAVMDVPFWHHNPCSSQP
jgi:hypothetical protein